MTNHFSDTEKRDLAYTFIALSIVFVGTNVEIIEGIPYRAQVVIAIFVSTLVFFLAKPVPYVVSSIYAVSLLYYYLYESFAQAATGFSTLLIYFLALLLLLGRSISGVGLGERVSLRLLEVTDSPKMTFRRMWIYILVLGLVMPSAIARLVTFRPIVDQLREAYGLPLESPFTRSSYLLLGHVNPLISVAFMTGGGLAVATSELLKLYTEPVTWLDWAIYMAPPVVLLYVLTSIIAELELSYRMANDSSGDRTLHRQRSDDGGEKNPLTRDQKIVILVLLCTILGWGVGSIFGLPTVIPALFAVLVLSFPGVGIITSEDVHNLNWGILFLFGAMFSLLTALQDEQVFDILGSHLSEMMAFGSWEVWQIVVGLCAIAVAIRFLFSTASAATIVTVPIAMEFGNMYGIDPLNLGLTIMMFMMSTAFLPFHTGTVLIAYESGRMQKRDVFTFGLITFVCTCIVVFVCWTVYWPLINAKIL